MIFKTGIILVALAVVLTLLSPFIFRFLGKTVFQYTGKFTAVLVIVGGFLCLVSVVLLAWSHLP